MGPRFNKVEAVLANIAGIDIAIQTVATNAVALVDFAVDEGAVSARWVKTSSNPRGRRQYVVGFDTYAYYTSMTIRR